MATNIHEKSRFIDTKSSDLKSLKKQESSSRSPGRSHKSKKHGQTADSIEEEHTPDISKIKKSEKSPGHSHSLTKQQEGLESGITLNSNNDWYGSEYQDLPIDQAMSPSLKSLIKAKHAFEGAGSVIRASVHKKKLKGKSGQT